MIHIICYWTLKHPTADKDGNKVITFAKHPQSIARIEGVFSGYGVQESFTGDGFGEMPSPKG